MEYQVLEGLVAKRLPSIDIRNPEALARAVYDACVEFATETGMLASEVDIRDPGEQRHIPSANGWTVVFEAGPYEWGILLSFFLLERGARLCEPDYSFDLTFYRDGE